MASPAICENHPANPKLQGERARDRFASDSVLSQAVPVSPHIRLASATAAAKEAQLVTVRWVRWKNRSPHSASPRCRVRTVAGRDDARVEHALRRNRCSCLHRSLILHGKSGEQRDEIPSLDIDRSFLPPTGCVPSFMMSAFTPYRRIGTGHGGGVKMSTRRTR